MRERFPQFELNGTENLWIVKPGHMSRGRGIKVFKQYDEILQFAKESKGSKFVV